MVKRLTLSPLGRRSTGGWHGVYWSLKADGVECFQLEHSVRTPLAGLLPPAEHGDHALLALLLHAMACAEQVEVEGSLSPRLLDGLETLQEIWCRWRPDRYRPITIRCSQELARSEQPGASPGGSREGLFAFSGGIDSIFSLLRHYHRKAGRHTVHPAATLLVQGFDIPYAEDHAYGSATERAKLVLEECPGLSMLQLRTNSRLIGQHWGDSFGLQLSACFLCFQRHYSDAVMGSGEGDGYDKLTFPWGSSPLTIPLGSTEAMTIHLDGCGYDRNNKVAFLSAYPKASRHIRVCWEGDRYDRNCGRCEKCVRTMLNYWANGLDVPSAFPTQLTPELVRSIVLTSDIEASGLKTIRSLARQRGLAPSSIMDAVQDVLRHYKHGKVQQRQSLRRQR
jgi:hypothetical protein